MGLLKRKMEELGYFDEYQNPISERYTRISYDEEMYHKNLEEAEGY